MIARKLQTKSGALLSAEMIGQPYTVDEAYNECCDILSAHYGCGVMKKLKLAIQPFDYTEWRKNNLFVGLSVDEISNAADRYCEVLC